MAAGLAQRRVAAATASSSGSRIVPAVAAGSVAAVRCCCRQVVAPVSGLRRGARHTAAAAATESQSDPNVKTIVQKVTPGDVPFPWSEKDPYRLPVSIDRVQKMLVTLGWEKPWVEQIVDRIMKGMLKTTEERAEAVITYLTSVGLKQDEICNMASISVVLLGLNPDTRLRPVVDYLTARGVPSGSVADLVLRHPRIFEYKVTPEGRFLSKGAARIQVDAVPSLTGDAPAVAVNYHRENAAFMVSPVSPVPPAP